MALRPSVSLAIGTNPTTIIQFFFPIYRIICIFAFSNLNISRWKKQHRLNSMNGRRTC